MIDNDSNCTGLRFQRPLVKAHEWDAVYAQLRGGVGWSLGETECDRIKKTMKIPYTGARFLIENVGKPMGF